MKELLETMKIEALVSGDGPPLVLLHSLLADRSSFSRVVGPLSRAFRVMLPALPGFGASPSVDGGLPAVADRIAAAIQAFAAGQPVRLLGNGYGGFIALQAVIRHPGLADRLVLADAGAAFSGPGRQAFRGMAEAAAAKGLEAIADIAMRRLFAPSFHAANPGLVSDRRRIFLASDPAVIIAACEALATLDLRPALTDVRIPVLAVVGELDEATPPAMSREAVAGLLNATLAILDGLAHVPQLQAPQRFLDAVMPFLSRRP
ncbi:alpha/beta fold hydrolase [Acidisphaera sp. S103]|uniref:alpha/beta fold hydrolase n=1 Tax=Acidisphaera sp. S103 TaxID=1747223 RepID=UPI001C207CF3|nr:alpha/beta fold hydrolase [Acidisphaera sp. S103]